MLGDDVLNLGAGEALHFRVSHPELGAGSTWRIKTKPATSDVYLEHVEGRRWVHSSFHASGEAHYALTPRALKKSPDDDKHFGVAPGSFRVAAGITHACRITVATTELSKEYVERSAPEKVLEVRAFTAADATTVNLYLTEQGVPDPTFVEQRLLARLSRGGQGGTAFITAAATSLDEPINEALAEVIDDIRAQLNAIAELAYPTRVVVSMQDPDAPGLMREVEVLIALPLTTE